MRLLWVGDAVVQTGFSRVTHNVVGRLKNRGWDVAVLGVCYNGDPHGYDYPIFPAMLGGDSHGVGRIAGLIQQMKPDVVVINNDPWIIPDYYPGLPEGVPVVAYMPVDAPNQGAAPSLGRVRAVSYTQFGRRELLIGGYSGRCDVIPHGVDSELYRPLDRNECRKRLKLKNKNLSELFIVGNVNRNQPRKRLDLTIQAWAQWWINAGQPAEAHLYLHCANRDEGWNIFQLAKYYGIESQLIVTNTKMTVVNSLFEQEMPLVYNMFDVQLSTTMGEGWGLTTHEGMACGIPQILPRYSALGEWCDEAAHFVDVTSFAVTPRGINTIGGVPDVGQIVEAIDKFYREPDYRLAMAQKAFNRATETRFNWDSVATQFDELLIETVMERRSKPVGLEAARG